MILLNRLQVQAQSGSFLTCQYHFFLEQDTLIALFRYWLVPGIEWNLFKKIYCSKLNMCFLKSLVMMVCSVFYSDVSNLAIKWSIKICFMYL